MKGNGISRRDLLKTGIVSLPALAAAAAPRSGLAQAGRPAPGVGAPIRKPSWQLEAGTGYDIYWDEYGVPYIFADTLEGLGYAWGWAQAKNHGNLLLVGIAKARGRAAEYFGADSGLGPNALTPRVGLSVDYVASDRLSRQMGYPALGQEWYAKNPESIRALVDAFGRGISDYGAKHPDEFDPRVLAALPVTGADVFAHAARTQQVGGRLAKMGVARGAFLTGRKVATPESGASSWQMFGPKRSASGDPLQFSNPHLAWDSEDEIVMQVELVMPRRARTVMEATFFAHGAGAIGLPALLFVAGKTHGYSVTSLATEGNQANYFEVPLLGDRHYRFDGQTRAFDLTTETIRVRQPDGSLVEQPLTILRSADHDDGPVIATRQDAALVVHLPGIHEHGPGCVEQALDMIRARTFEEFRTAVRRLQVLSVNIAYTGRDEGTNETHLMAAWGGAIPRRPFGDADTWEGPVDGSVSKNVVKSVHTFDELPKVIDPPADFVQNQNEPPTFYTMPPAFKPSDYPRYMVNAYMGARGRNSLRLFGGDDQFTLEALIRRRHDTRSELAVMVVDELVAAAGQHGTTLAKRAADVLAKWDRQVTADSRGPLLFLLWYQVMGPRWQYAGDNPVDLFAQPENLALAHSTDWRRILDAPRRLRDPKRAAAALDTAAGMMLARTGALDNPFGSVIRRRAGRYAFPADGGDGRLGVSRLCPLPREWQPDPKAVTGEGTADSFMMAVQYAKPGPIIRTILGYGNATQPGSPHHGDQLPLFTRLQMRAIDPMPTARKQFGGKL